MAGQGIIDGGTQFISPTPPGTNPAGQNVFRNYGMLDVYHHGTDVDRMLAAMDEAGIEIALMAGDNESVARAAAKHPGRIVGEYHADPTDIMAAVRGLEHYVREHGFKALRIEPFLWRKPPTNRVYYPLYAKCVELDLPMCVNAGVPGPRVPMACQHVERLDPICYDFPELTLVIMHGAEPWTALAVKLMLKWPGLHYMTSAFAPKHYPKDVVAYANSRGADKVMYCGYPAGLTYERQFGDLPNVPFKDEVWPKFLRENALRVYRIEEAVARATTVL